MNEKIGDGDMGDKNKSEGSLLGIFLFVSFLLGGIVFLIIQLVRFLISIWQFFTEPNLLPRIIEYIKAFGLCCGGVILFFVVFGFLYNILTPKYPDDSDDYHASR
jgi:hypothetical protein